jgi:hypothetical protein
MAIETLVLWPQILYGLWIFLFHLYYFQIIVHNHIRLFIFSLKTIHTCIKMVFYCIEVWNIQEMVCMGKSYIVSGF